METVTINNTAPRMFNLPLLVLYKAGRGKPPRVLRPLRANGAKEVARFGARRIVQAGERLSVPSWYFDHLRTLGGWSKRMDADGLITGTRIGQREGNHLLASVRAKAKQAIGDAREQVRQHAGEVADARARAAESAAVAADQAERIAELEASLAAAPSPSKFAELEASLAEAEAAAKDGETRKG